MFQILCILLTLGPYFITIYYAIVIPCDVNDTLERLIDSFS